MTSEEIVRAVLVVAYHCRPEAMRYAPEKLQQEWMVAIAQSINDVLRSTNNDVSRGKSSEQF